MTSESVHNNEKTIKRLCHSDGGGRGGVSKRLEGFNGGYLHSNKMKIVKIATLSPLGIALSTLSPLFPVCACGLMVAGKMNRGLYFDQDTFNHYFDLEYIQSIVKLMYLCSFIFKKENLELEYV